MRPDLNNNDISTSRLFQSSIIDLMTSSNKIKISLIEVPRARGELMCLFKNENKEIH